MTLFLSSIRRTCAPPPSPHRSAPGLPVGHKHGQGAVKARHVPVPDKSRGVTAPNFFHCWEAPYGRGDLGAV